MELLIFIGTYLFICNWFQIISFGSMFFGPRYKTSNVHDAWIQSIVKKKTGLSLLDITIVHTSKMYGMMAGLPFWPKMILSEGLYESFNKDELEWVILHEAGHCVLWHNLQALLIQIGMMSIGIYTTMYLKVSLLGTIFIAILFSLITIHITRWGIEYMADRYSIRRVDNPGGVITAQDKFRKAYNTDLFHSESSIFRFFLHWNITSSMRIRMAEDILRHKNHV